MTPAQSIDVSAGGLPPSTFGELLELARREVNAVLADLFEAHVPHAGREGESVAAVFDALRDLTMRAGKRLRPALVCAAYWGTDEGAPGAPAFRAGAAIELYQSYLLIHDDWMDGDDVRRGGPSAHVALARRLASPRLGERAAVLAGDLAAAMAFEVLASIDAPADRVLRATERLAEAGRLAVWGQALDVAGQGDAERLAELKTASYTVAAPLAMGADLAGADAGVARALVDLARPTGVAFQLRDDLIGAFGSQEQTGKPTGSDVRSGKRTLLIAEALRRAGPAAREAIACALGRADATDDVVERATDAMRASGAVEAVERRIAELAARAVAAARLAPLDPRGRRWLEEAIAALASRSA